MKKWLLAIALFLSFLYFMFLAYGCSLYVSIEGKKKETTVLPATAPPAPVASKPKPKNRITELREEHNKEWLNLPHDPIDSKFFPTDSNYNNDGKNWERKSYN